MDNVEYLYRLICAQIDRSELTDEEIALVVSAIKSGGGHPRQTTQLMVG